MSTTLTGDLHGGRGAHRVGVKNEGGSKLKGPPNLPNLSKQLSIRIALKAGPKNYNINGSPLSLSLVITLRSNTNLIK